MNATNTFGPTKSVMEELGAEDLGKVAGGSPASKSESAKETVTFEYGALQVRYGQQ
jgi:hypothetical protein